MIFHVCRKCKKRVWFWQSNAAITLHMEDGKTKVINLCLECGIKLADHTPPGFIPIEQEE